MLPLIQLYHYLTETHQNTYQSNTLMYGSKVMTNLCLNAIKDIFINKVIYLCMSRK